MGLRINTNVLSMNAQNNMKSTTSKLNTSLQRLSTGLRINSGKDDSVGLAKSEGLRSLIRGIDVAKNNITQANSVFGVAEGYLSQLTEVSQQMREVAVQGANGTLSASDRESLKTKFADLMSEYNRLANGANFNGVGLLDGTFTGKNIQVGAKEGETITVSINDARSATIGQVAIYTAAARTAQATALSGLSLPGDGTVTINGTGMGSLSSDGVSNSQATESALAYVNAINASASTTGVTATVLSNVFTMDYSAGSSMSGSAIIMLNGVTVRTAGANVFSATNDTEAQTFVTAVNNKSALTGVTATLDTTNDKVIFTANDGRNIDFQVTNTTTYNVFGLTGSASYTNAVYRGSFKLTSTTSFTLASATDDFTTTGANSIGVDSGTALTKSAVDTASNASTAISILDNVISQLQSRRGVVGSTSNRLDIAAAELDSRQENLSSAESNIRDADIAAETARLTQQQILQQAGVTVLGQANSAPQIALTLLQNI